MYPEVVQSQVPGGVSSGPSQRWGRRGDRDAVRYNNPTVAALAQEGCRQSFRPFTFFWELELAVPNLDWCLIA